MMVGFPVFFLASLIASSIKSTSLPSETFKYCQPNASNFFSVSSDIASETSPSSWISLESYKTISFPKPKCPAKDIAS